MSIKLLPAILFATAALGGMAFAGDTGPQTAEVLPFMIGIEFTPEQIAVTALDGGGWALQYGSDGEGSNSCYVSPGRVSGELDPADMRQYCFEVEFGVDGITLTSLRGTKWATLGYSCGDASPCRVVVTENGVKGR
ncbi:MAG: hypothetical protein IPP62_17990 [bacterium]|nr:hypothetical protein [bacterium]